MTRAVPTTLRQTTAARSMVDPMNCLRMTVGRPHLPDFRPLTDRRVRPRMTVAQPHRPDLRLATGSNLRRTQADPNRRTMVDRNPRLPRHGQTIHPHPTADRHQTIAARPRRLARSVADVHVHCSSHRYYVHRFWSFAILVSRSNEQRHGKARDAFTPPERAESLCALGFHADRGTHRGRQSSDHRISMRCKLG